MFIFFFFNDTATTEIYTLSLHDALPILSMAIFMRVSRSRRQQGNIATMRWANMSGHASVHIQDGIDQHHTRRPRRRVVHRDRKSTRLNSSHANISYAVFCLKKKKNSNTYFYYILCYHLSLTHSISILTRSYPSSYSFILVLSSRFYLSVITFYL